MDCMIVIASLSDAGNIFPGRTKLKEQYTTIRIGANKKAIVFLAKKMHTNSLFVP